MSGSLDDASGGEGSAIGRVQRLGEPSQVIGKIQTVIGSGTLTRADGVVIQVKAGDPVCQGDVIETASDCQIAIHFIDNTVFNLSGNSRVELNEFVCDGDGTLHSGLFDIARGSFAFRTGQVAKAGFLTIETPDASIRGRARSGGIGTLSLTALTFAILDEAQAQVSNGNPFLIVNPLSHGATYSEDGLIILSETKFGIVEVQVHGSPEIKVLDRPDQSLLVPRGSSTAEVIANTPQDMVRLQTFQNDVLASFVAGLARPTFTNATSTGSSAPPPDLSTSPFIQPINYIQPDSHLGGQGNTSTSNSSNSSNFIFVPPPPPPPPTITISTPIVHGRVSPSNTLNASEANGGFDITGITSGIENGQTVTVTIDNASTAVVETFFVTVANNSWSVHLNPANASALVLPDGSYTVTANVSNAAGDPAPPVSGNLIVDETPPAITIAAVNGNSIVNGTEAATGFAISGTTTGAESGQAVTVQIVDGSNAVVDSYTTTAGSGTWSVNVTPAQAQALADGVYTVTADVSDVAGNPADQATSSVVRINDAPVITAQDLIGAVTEQVTPAGNLSDSGVITFTDVDLTDVHLVSANGTPIGTTLGSLTAVKDSDTTGTGTGGQLHWTYTVADSAVEYLAAGQTKVESFTITLDDQHGGLITKQIDVTITGTDDAPVITAQDLIGAVTEQVTPAGNLSDSGVITFTDVDLTDVHLVSANGTPIGTTLGSLTAVKDSDTTGTGTGGQLTWTYTVADSAVEYLAAGQTKVESFTITLDDQHGGLITKQIDVTITGTNDAPVITAQDLIGAVTEQVTPAGNLSDSGVITFTDVDLTDVHLVSANGTPIGTTLGSLTAVKDSDTTGTGTGGQLHLDLHGCGFRRSSIWRPARPRSRASPSRSTTSTAV